MRGGPVPGSVRFTRGEAELALAVSVANVSRKHVISGHSFCRGNEILELVRASHNSSSSVEVDGPNDCGAPMVTCCISVCIRATLLFLAVSIHSLVACRTSSCTFHWGLGFAACSDVLNVGHNTIHGWGLAGVRGWALVSVLAELVTLKVGNCGRVTSVRPICVWGRV